MNGVISTEAMIAAFKRHLIRINRVFPVLFALAAPFNLFVPELGVIWILSWLLEGDLRQKFSIARIKERKMILYPLFLFYGWLVLSTLFHFSWIELNHIDKYWGLLFFPLIFQDLNHRSGPPDFRWVMGAYIFGFVVIAFTSIGLAVLKHRYFYVDFITLFPTHWYPLLLNGALLFLIHILLTSRFNNYLTLLLFIVVVMFIGTIYLISFRSLILSSFFSSIVILTPHLKTMNRPTQIVLISFLITISFLYLRHPRFAEIERHPSMDWRIPMWKASLEVITQGGKSFWVGFGLEKAKKKTNAAFRKIPDAPGFLQTKDNSAHNDFLDILLLHGFIGGALFMTLFVSSGIHAYSRKDYLALAFLVMVVIQFSFGSYYFWFGDGKYIFFFLWSALFFSRTDVPETLPVDSPHRNASG